MISFDSFKFHDMFTMKFVPSKEAEKIILLRTPYNSQNYLVWAENLVKRLNSIVYIQDVRGRYQSNGEWIPYKNEEKDCFLLAEHVNKNNNKNLPVFVVGSSYEAYTARLTALYLKNVGGVVLRVGVRSEYEAMYNNNSFRLSDRIWWMMTHGLNKESDYNTFQELLTNNPDIWKWSREEWCKFLDYPFLFSMVTKGVIPFPKCPVYIIGGWRDGYVDGSWRDYINWLSTNKNIIIGDWDHSLHSEEMKKVKEITWLKDHKDLSKSRYKIMSSNDWVINPKLNKDIITIEKNFSRSFFYSDGIESDYFGMPLINGVNSLNIPLKINEIGFYIGTPILEYRINEKNNWYAQIIRKSNGNIEILSTFILKPENINSIGMPFAFFKDSMEIIELRVSPCFHPIYYSPIVSKNYSIHIKNLTIYKKSGDKRGN